MNYLLIFLSLIPFYFIGAFPSGYLIAKKFGKDITGAGSGNVGATNVARVIGKKAGALTLIADVFKGVLAVSLARLLWPGVEYASLVAFVTVLGHCISLPPLLKGGKGVATALGSVLVLSPLAILIGIVLFTLMYLITNIVSLGSVVAVLGTSLAAIFLESNTSLIAAICCISLLVIYRHKSNLMRLSEGREEKLSI